MLTRFKKIVKNSVVFRAYSEYLLRKAEIGRFIAEINEKLIPTSISGNEDIRSKYIADLKKYMFTFDEWYSLYDLSNADEKTKSSYISRSRAQKWYRRLVKPEIRNIFHSKPIFLTTFPDNIFRKYLICDSNTTLSDISDILKCDSLIVKPQSGSLGQGVYKLTREEIEKLSPADFLRKCKEEKSLIEECITGCDQIQRFHPQSLNTIRVMTAFDGKSHSVFGSFIRFGRGGQVVDNAHAGGIFCGVDITDGTICSDGTDTDGHIYKTHPDSGLRFNGFKIPRWSEIVQTCCDAHSKVDIPFVGWDVVVTDAGNIEFVEGNHAPDLDIIQGPVKKGRFNDFTDICKRYSRR